MSETLYDRLGGADGVETVVDGFYDRVLDDESLVEYFEATDMTDLREHQREFITMVTGGPSEYDGPDMREAHAHLDLDGKDFVAVAGHLDDALAAAGVADADREAVLSAVADLEADVLNR
jgi:hemoglobin